MRTFFLVLATSATILATGLSPVAASEHRYCLEGDDYAGLGDCGFVSYQQCQATASGRMAYCVPKPGLAIVLINRAGPRRH
jgi:hypothetical protein